MAVKDPTATQIDTLTASGGTRDSLSGVKYIPDGTKPYGDNVNAALYHLARSRPLMVRKSDANNTTIYILPGNCHFSGAGTLVQYAGGEVDLAAYNNDTAYVWLNPDGTIGHGTDGAGWPGTEHCKLASVTLASGTFEESDIVDFKPDYTI